MCSPPLEKLKCDDIVPSGAFPLRASSIASKLASLASRSLLLSQRPAKTPVHEPYSHSLHLVRPGFVCSHIALQIC